MRETLVESIRKKGLMHAGERVGVAVSGGADSVALLRLLLEARAELGVVLSVVHFNHKLRGAESDADEAFVRALAEEHGLEFFCDSGDTRTYAAERKCGIEAAAREMRYGFFRKLLAQEKPEPQRRQRGAMALDRIATAHTMDDQAETVVMRFARGAGTRGMAGIYPAVGEGRSKRSEAEDAEENTRSLDSVGQNRADSARDDKFRWGDSARDDKASGWIVRPLLEFRRAQLRHYLRRAGQAWREDASNADVAFARNRVRHEVMPKLRELNPAIEMVLSETAEIARAEEEYWREMVEEKLQQITKNTSRLGKPQGQTKGPSTPAAQSGPPPLGMTNSSGAPALGMTNASGAPALAADINIAKLLNLPVALRRRVVREFAERRGVRLEFHHVEQVLEVAAVAGGRAQKRVELTEGWDACVAENCLRLEQRRDKKEKTDYELPLPVPGQVRVDAVGVVVRARMAESGARIKAGPLRVRNWRPGDRYWPAHTGSEKKVKELMQDRRVPAEDRAAWPVVVSDGRGAAGEQIVWVPGFAYPEQWTTESGPGVVLEMETAPEGRE